MRPEGDVGNNGLDLPDREYRPVNQSKKDQSRIVLDNREFENQRQCKHHDIQQIANETDFTEKVHIFSTLNKLPKTTSIPIEYGIQGNDIQQTSQNYYLFWSNLKDITDKERYTKDDQRIDNAYRTIKGNTSTKQSSDILNIIFGQIVGEVPEVSIREPKIQQCHIDIDRQCQSYQSIIRLTVESYQNRHGHERIGRTQELAGYRPDYTICYLIDGTHFLDR
jgi:hypothetical protein